MPNATWPGGTAPRGNADEFSLHHYAGVVKYNGDGFLEKNRDRLLDALADLTRAYSNAVMARMAARDDANAAAKKKDRRTLGGKFRKQLDALVAVLGGCAPHFVRCIKPNALKRPDVFDSAMVQAQMRCAGVLEVCRIRRVGFPYRLQFAHFLRRYGCLGRVRAARDFAARR